MSVKASVYILLTSVWVAACQGSESCPGNISGCDINLDGVPRKCEDGNSGWNNRYPCHVTESMAVS